MTDYNPFSIVERKLLGRFPDHSEDPERVAGFQDSFGSSVIEAADTVALLIGIVKLDDLAGIAERLATIVTDAIGSAASMVGVSGSSWVPQAQRWAVEAFFARIATVCGSMVDGGIA